MSEIYLYENLTSEIIKACYTIHNELGCGFLERVYQEALAISWANSRYHMNERNIYLYHIMAKL